METVESANHNTLSPTPYTNLVETMTDLLIEDADELYFDEANRQPGGIVRFANLETDAAATSSTVVAISLYDPSQTRRQTAALRARGHEVEEAIGHIRFDKILQRAQVICTAYLQKNGQVRVYGECSVADTEELLWEDSEACYDFMEAAGLGKAWAKFLFNGEANQQFVIDTDDQIVTALTTFVTDSFQLGS